MNLSPVQLRSSGLVRCIGQALGVSGLSPDRLELEITEGTLLEDSDAMLAILYQLRELGVCVAIADFGTGCSSLNCLQGFPFDRIKIDRSFIKDIAESTGSLNIVRAVTALAKGLGMAATAEGVETIEQRSTVASEGCGEMRVSCSARPFRPMRSSNCYFHCTVGRRPTESKMPPEWHLHGTADLRWANVSAPAEPDIPPSRDGSGLRELIAVGVHVLGSRVTHS